MIVRLFWHVMFPRGRGFCVAALGQRAAEVYAMRLYLKRFGTAELPLSVRGPRKVVES